MKKEKNTNYRKIIHIDMDAFFAAIEQLDFPEYRGKPLVVGGNNQRGVVAAASYEARKYGIHSAMPSKIAAKKCDHLIFVRPRFQRYKEISSHVFTILKAFTETVEMVSIDEAYLDVTRNLSGGLSATLIAKDIKSKIKDELKLTASAGVSYNKFLAKIASDFKKPDGLFVIHPKDASVFLTNLSIEKFHGVGKVTTQKMHKLGIFTGKDLKAWTKEDIQKIFGKYGLFYYNVVRGIDNRPVTTKHIRKSLSTEKTFKKDIHEPMLIKKAFNNIMDELIRRMERKKTTGKTITLKIKFYDFDMITRSYTSSEVLSEKKQIAKVAFKLLSETPIKKPVRLLGIGISNFNRKEKQHPEDTQLKLKL